MTYKVTLIPGDGIGPEIADAARRVMTDKSAVTYDLGGTASTSGMADAIIAKLK